MLLPFSFEDLRNVTETFATQFQCRCFLSCAIDRSIVVLGTLELLRGNSAFFLPKEFVLWELCWTPLDEQIRETVERVHRCWKFVYQPLKSSSHFLLNLLGTCTQHFCKLKKRKERNGQIFWWSLVTYLLAKELKAQSDVQLKKNDASTFQVVEGSNFSILYGVITEIAIDNGIDEQVMKQYLLHGFWEKLLSNGACLTLAMHNEMIIPINMHVIIRCELT